MNLQFKFQHTDNIFATADTHFNHDKEFIWKARGYKSKENHTKGVIEKINQLVKPDDKLIHCGDLSLNSTVADLWHYHNAINCNNIYLLWGNHNNPLWKVYREEIEQAGHQQLECYPWRLKQFPKFILVGNLFQFYWKKQFFVCSHFPLMIWDLMKYESICLTGHSHGNCPQTNLSNKTNKILDVGIDIHGQPLSLDAVNRILKNNHVVIPDHHGKS
jgi:calcineurin-like phosphoesterase family protein